MNVIGMLLIFPYAFMHEWELFSQTCDYAFAQPLLPVLPARSVNDVIVLITPLRSARDMVSSQLDRCGKQRHHAPLF